MTATVPRVLRDAADLIERDRQLWGLMGSGITFYLATAASYAPADLGAWGEARKAMTSVLGGDIRAWESAEGRTTAEVLAALRGAADAWEAEHG